MTTWEEIRAQWVNGNLTDAKEKLYQQSKTRIFRVISEALERYIALGGKSGDLTDLREIVKSLGGR